MRDFEQYYLDRYLKNSITNEIIGLAKQFVINKNKGPIYWAPLGAL